MMEELIGVDFRTCDCGGPGQCALGRATVDRPYHATFAYPLSTELLMAVPTVLVRVVGDVGHRVFHRMAVAELAASLELGLHYPDGLADGQTAT